MSAISLGGIEGQFRISETVEENPMNIERKSLTKEIALYHGDCLGVLPTLSTASIDLILTDLPYCCTNNKWDLPVDLSTLWREWNRIIKPKGAIILTANFQFGAQLLSVANKNKYRCREWIWNKSRATNFLNSKKQPLVSHEHVLVFSKAQPTYHPQMQDGKPYNRPYSGGGSTNYGHYNVVPSKSLDGKRFPLSVICIPSEIRVQHPTQKPVALFEYFMRTYSNPGETVLDCCAGSGTTGVAARNVGRKAILIEQDASYVNVIHERLRVQEDVQEDWGKPAREIRHPLIPKNPFRFEIRRNSEGAYDVTLFHADEQYRKRIQDLEPVGDNLMFMNQRNALATAAWFEALTAFKGTLETGA